MDTHHTTNNSFNSAFPPPRRETESTKIVVIVVSDRPVIDGHSHSAANPNLQKDLECINVEEDNTSVKDY